MYQYKRRLVTISSRKEFFQYFCTSLCYLNRIEKLFENWILWITVFQKWKLQPLFLNRKDWEILLNPVKSIWTNQKICIKFLHFIQLKDFGILFDYSYRQIILRNKFYMSLWRFLQLLSLLPQNLKIFVSLRSVMLM